MFTFTNRQVFNLEEWQKMVMYELSFPYFIILVGMDNWSKSNGTR